MNNLNKRAWLGFVFVSLVMGLLLFVPAWTIQYWQAWAYLTIFFGSSLLTILYLMEKDPALLARRMGAGHIIEKETTQKIIRVFLSIVFVVLLVVPALDHRFRWSCVDPLAVIAADMLVATGFYIIFLAYKENPFAASTIQVEKGQKVISTGPYAIVRHPIYSGALLMLLATPPALGSWWGLLVLVPMIPLLIWRLFDEEKFLSKNLAGYTEYCERVRSRLIPRIF